MTLTSKTSGAGALEFTSPGEAHLPGGAGGQTPEALGVLLLHVVRAHALEATDGAAIELVSLTLDVTGTAEPDAPLSFTADIDRKTRTIIFTGGAAKADGQTVLTATAIFRILTGA